MLTKQQQANKKENLHRRYHHDSKRNFSNVDVLMHIHTQIELTIECLTKQIRENQA